MKLTLVGKKEEAKDVTSFIFKPEEPIAWVPGQYLHYILEHPNPDERKMKRYFTISAAPHEDHIMLTARFTEGDGSTFKKALHELSLGDTIEGYKPGGQFTVEDMSQDYVFIAGGIGITPYRAILLDLDYNKKPINVTLLYGNRDEDFVFKEELEALSKKYPNFKIHYFIEPERINETAIKKIVPDLTTPIFYVSGPEPMVEAFEKMLAEMGIPEEHIKRDYFPGYTWP